MNLAQVSTGVDHTYLPIDQTRDWIARNDPNGTIEIVLITLLIVMVLYGFLKKRAVAWAWFKKTYSSWKEGRKVRRDEKLRQERGACAVLEAWLDRELDEGDMDPTTANKWRHKFSKVLRDMAPKKDVKGGIKLRLRSPFYCEPVQLPDQAGLIGPTGGSGRSQAAAKKFGD